MNNDRRKAIRALYPQVEDLEKLHEAAKAAIEAFHAAAEELKGDVETIRDEEQEYINNLPENMQQGEKAQNAEQAVSDLDEAADMLYEPSVEDFDGDDLISKLNEVEGGN